MGEEMNTFTFTDEEVEAIKTSLDQYKNNLAIFHNMLTSSGVSESIMKERNSAINGAINKLERNPPFHIQERCPLLMRPSKDIDWRFLTPSNEIAKPKDNKGDS